MAAKHIIAVHSAKGGVGKSTVAVNLAVGLGRLGARVGLLDADIYGPSIAKMLGNSSWPQESALPETVLPLEAHGIKFISMGNLTTPETPLIWRGAMLNSALNQFFTNVDWGELDYLLIDMPPGTGDAQLTISQNTALSGAVVVTTPQELAINDTVRGARAFQGLEVPILGLIENMSFFICDECQTKAEIFGESTIDFLADELKTEVLARIPIESEICMTGDDGHPLILAEGNHPAAKALSAAVDRLLEKLEKTASSAVLELAWVEMEAGQRITVPPRHDVETGMEIKTLWQVSNNELGVAWKGGSVSIVSVRKLRLACPCASCVDEWTGEDLLDPTSVPENLTLSRIHSVGRYAIQPVFSDGHDTGLFHFDRIRKCAEVKND